MKKIVIIGAGVAGMAAGIYAQLNGFKSEIYEQHSGIGGECTAWFRKGYTIDGSISWLTGVKPGTKICEVWNEVGAFQEEDISYGEEFAVVEMDGQCLHWYREVDRLEKHLCELSEEDERSIFELTTIIRGLNSFEIPSKKPVDLMDKFEKREYINNFMKVFQVIGPICSLTVEQYVERFHSKLIQNALLSFSFKDNLVQGVLVTLASIASGQAGWINGGSKQLTDNMQRTYLKLGGKIFCKEKVERINIQEETAVGIVLENQKVINADYVIPACDIYVTMKKLLQNNYKDSVLDQYFDNKEYKTSSISQVAFGIDYDLSAYPEKMIHIFDEIEVAGEKINSCLFTHYCKEEEFAPSGKSIIKTGLTIYNYENWIGLTREQYTEKKEDIKNAYLELLYRYYPETIDKVEMIDVTTPLTYERYCGAHKGAYMAFMLTKATNRISHNGVIKNLKSVYIAGQWLSALGGLPDALVSGKNAIQRICNVEGISFLEVQ